MDDETRRKLDDLRQGGVVTTGQFTLADNPATSTVVTRRSVSANSVIHLMPYSTLATMADITYIVPAKGQFTVHHTASASTRTFRYSFVTGSILS